MCWFARINPIDLSRSKAIWLIRPKMCSQRTRIQLRNLLVATSSAVSGCPRLALNRMKFWQSFRVEVRRWTRIDRRCRQTLLHPRHRSTLRANANHAHWPLYFCSLRATCSSHPPWRGSCNRSAFHCFSTSKVHRSPFDDLWPYQTQSFRGARLL